MERSVFDRIVSDVCGVVGVGDPSALFQGGVKGDKYTNTARRFVYGILHDCYGLSYNVISGMTGRTVRQVMSSISQLRHIRFIDAEYIQIVSALKERGYTL